MTKDNEEWGSTKLDAVDEEDESSVNRHTNIIRSYVIFKGKIEKNVLIIKARLRRHSNQHEFKSTVYNCNSLKK